MTFKELILSAFGFVISYFLKKAFSEALCSINSFGCFMAFIMYTLPVIIIVAYWMIKLYPYIEPYLSK
ncbi:hypothetical protein FJZ17_04415 [Candidatus Pacearchaeota archaeon]|nr:hypothetical protein [Candidatus Pacearchaeota archaeon]